VELRERVQAIVKGLRKMYPDAHCELDHKTPLELLVATILSAQCTDKRVNMVTPTLFKKYRTAQDYAKVDKAELEGLIRSTGFFRSKAKSIQETAKALVAKHGGKVPDTMEELLQLRGVARKTANVILGTAYGKSCGIVVDTHMKRLAFRLGLTDETEPEKIELDLMRLVPKKDWISFSQGMVWHGRRVCFARNPDCPSCALNKICPKRGV
jgi:endonuclease-3